MANISGKRACAWLFLPLTICLVAVAVGETRSSLLLRNTALVAFGAAAIAIPAGVITAWLLTKTDSPGRRLSWTVVVAMLFMPVYLLAAGWDAGLGRQGWLTSWSAGASTLALAGWPATIWIHAVAATPWVVVIASRGFALVEPELEEAALLDTGLLRVALRVSLVRALPAVVIAALAVCVLTSGEIAVTDLYQIRTFAEEIFLAGQSGGSAAWEPQSADILGGAVVMSAIVFSAVVVAAQLSPQQAQPAWRSVRVFPLGRWRWAGGVWLFSGIGLMAVVPLANLVSQIGLVVGRTDRGWTRSWSIRKAADLLLRSCWEFREEFAWTMILGLLAATAAMSIGLLLARLARPSRFARFTAYGIISFGFAIPGPAVGLAIVWGFQLSHSPAAGWLYEDTILAPLLAQMVRCLPLATWLSWYAMQTIPSDLIETAELEGAGPFRLFWRVERPLRLPEIGAGWLAALTLSVGELAATNLTAPPGLSTVPVRIFGLLHAGVDDLAAALCLIVVGVTFGASMVWLTLWSARWRHEESCR